MSTVTLQIQTPTRDYKLHVMLVNLLTLLEAKQPKDIYIHTGNDVWTFVLIEQGHWQKHINILSRRDLNSRSSDWRVLTVGRRNQLSHGTVNYLI